MRGTVYAVHADNVDLNYLGMVRGQFPNELWLNAGFII